MRLFPLLAMHQHSQSRDLVFNAAAASEGEPSAVPNPTVYLSFPICKRGITQAYPLLTIPSPWVAERVTRWNGNTQQWAGRTHVLLHDCGSPGRANIRTQTCCVRPSAIWHLPPKSVGDTELGCWGQTDQGPSSFT